MKIEEEIEQIKTYLENITIGLNIMFNEIKMIHEKLQINKEEYYYKNNKTSRRKEIIE